VQYPLGMPSPPWNKGRGKLIKKRNATTYGKRHPKILPPKERGSPKGRRAILEGGRKNLIAKKCIQEKKKEKLLKKKGKGHGEKASPKGKRRREREGKLQPDPQNRDPGGGYKSFKRAGKRPSAAPLSGVGKVLDFQVFLRKGAPLFFHNAL